MTNPRHLSIIGGGACRMQSASACCQTLAFKVHGSQWRYRNDLLPPLKKAIFLPLEKRERERFMRMIRLWRSLVQSLRILSDSRLREDMLYHSRRDVQSCMKTLSLNSSSEEQAMSRSTSLRPHLSSDNRHQTSAPYNHHPQPQPKFLNRFPTPEIQNLVTARPVPTCCLVLPRLTSSCLGLPRPVSSRLITTSGFVSSRLVLNYLTHTAP